MSGRATSLLRAVVSYGERQLPAAAVEDTELRRRGRAGLAFAGVFLTQVPIFSATFALMDASVAAALVALFTGPTLAFTPVLMRRSVRIGSTYVIAVIWVTLYALSFLLGGWHSPSLFWMAALPVMAMLSVSTRSAVLWLVVVALSNVSHVVMREVGLRFPGIRTEVDDAIFHALAVSMLALVVFALGYSGESLRASMMSLVERVNTDMRLVLDNVEQALVTVDKDGCLGATHSATAERWFGRAKPGEKFADWIGRSDQTAGTWLGIGIAQVFEGWLPHEVTLAQLLRGFRVGERSYSLKYHPILQSNGELRAVLVVVTDATEQVRAARAQAAQHELMMIFTHLMRDREGVVQFFAEASELVARWDHEPDSALRLVHTLKGNAGLFGLDTIMEACHEVESQAVAEERAPTPEELTRLRSLWQETEQRMRPLLAEEADPINVSESDLLALERMVGSGASIEQITRTLRALRHDRAAQVFQRMGEQAIALANRLGKCEVKLLIDDRGMRFDPKTWARIWSVMVHVVRNAVDHGGEPTDARLARGKPAALTLRFESTLVNERVRVTVSDDGAGIDWERVRERARSAGLPHTSAQDLHEALFSDGLSTKSEATLVSGRGVGMGALREACDAIGASVHVRSEHGIGTSVEIEVCADTGVARLAS